MKPSDAPSVPAVAYKATDRATGHSRVICPDCITDTVGAHWRETGYRYADWYDGEPEPMSQSDVDGWSEGQGVSCDSCCVELVR